VLGSRPQEPCDFSHKQTAPMERHTLLVLAVELLARTRRRLLRPTIAYLRSSAIFRVVTLAVALAAVRRSYSAIQAATAASSRRRRLGAARPGLCGTLLPAEGIGDEEVDVACLGDAGRIAAFESLQELLRAGVCCDVTLRVEGRAFKAHKCVLAAASVPLRVMFESGFKEGRESVIGESDTPFDASNLGQIHYVSISTLIEQLSVFTRLCNVMPS
jgi:BTB/POZ domain